MYLNWSFSRVSQLFIRCIQAFAYDKNVGTFSIVAKVIANDKVEHPFLAFLDPGSYQWFRRSMNISDVK